MAASVEEVVESFIDAFNNRDLESLLALSDPGIEVEFTARSLSGHEGIRGYLAKQADGVAPWVSHGRRFQRGDELVAESRQELRFVESGEIAGVEVMWGVYTVKDGRVSRYREYGEMSAALAASAAGEEHEIDATTSA